MHIPMIGPLSMITMPEPVRDGAAGFVVMEDGSQRQVIYRRIEMDWSTNGELRDAGTNELLAFGNAMTHYRGGQKPGYLWADLTAYLNTETPCHLPLRQTYGGDLDHIDQDGKRVYKNPPTGQIIVRFPL